jgi:quercetin dioxygenase-like cupin family protein
MGTTPLEPVAVAPGEGKVWHLLGELIVGKITSAQTGGEFAVVEEYSPPHGGPPLHLHHHEDEIIHVLEGRLEFRCGADSFTAEAGATIFLPRNQWHTFKNIGSVPSHVQVVLLPGGLETFFAEIDRLAPIGEPAPGELRRLSEQYGLEIAG